MPKQYPTGNGQQEQDAINLPIMRRDPEWTECRQPEQPRGFMAFTILDDQHYTAKYIGKEGRYDEDSNSS